MRIKGIHTAAFLAILGLGLGASSCISAYTASVGGESAQIYERIFLTDFNTAWQATLDALKNSRLDVTNREGGFLQTKWTENTAEKNFTDSFGGADSYLKAQFRLRVSVSKGFYNGQSTIKVSVEKEQLVQRDVLEGWKPITTDLIDETTLLYRVGRLIYMRMKFAKIEEEKTRKEIENSGF